MRWKLGILLAVLSLAFACTSPQTTPTRPDNPDAEPLIEYLDQLVAIKQFRGVVEVRRGDELVLRRGFGHADLAAGTPNRPDTRFSLASVTKQFTGLAVLVLQEQGKLRVTDPVCVHVPNCPPHWQPITVEHLLTHTSGLWNYTDDLATVEQRVGPRPTPEQLIQAFADRPLIFPPGSRWEYNNSGYSLLGHVVEQVSGEPYGDFLRREILDPLGMSDTSYEPGPVPDDTAVGYADWTTPAAAINGSVAFTAGGMYSTVIDLGRWEQFLLTGRPAVVRQDTLAELLRPRVRANTGTADWYCYGIIARDTELGEDSYWHNGGGFGTSTYVEVIPATDVSVTVLANLDTDPTHVGRTLVSLLPNPR